MKLKQLLISTTSIAALAVVPMSIVSCGNNNNNAVEGLPSTPGEDNNNQPGGSDNDGSINGGGNSTPGNGDNSNSNPDGSTGGSNNGGDNNNQKPLPPIDEPIYIDVNSRYDMEDYILSNIHIISALIKQVTPSFNNIMFYFEWKTVPQLAYDSGMWITKEGEYTYYNVKNVKFTFSTSGEILKYQYVDAQGNKMTAYISGIQSVTVSVDIHFRSTTDFIGGGLGR
ncbi:hypothetical protein ACJA29_01465 [Metamycoplasma sualvi]|uniref:hypothetical protein n=1 Tax=Metamycoplasma sualvi TaxID=2125 RepID=UPI003872D0C2